MKLSKIEFIAMNNPVRRFMHKHLEFRLFRNMGLKEENKEILEIGCGSGYGAVLLSSLKPKSYAGIDLMPEQINLANKRNLPEYKFMVMDATDLSYFQDRSKDIIVAFGILHHILGWDRVLKECHRVLRQGGKLFIEEPEGATVKKLEKIISWGHPKDALFSLKEFEKSIMQNGFSIKEKKKLFFFGLYCAVK